VRKEALKLLLSKYTLERIATLSPNTISTADTSSLTQIITKHYTKDDVQQQVDMIISKSPKQYEMLLNDNRLQYPDYAISQAKFIRDEIEALGKEYIATYKSYQNSIEKVLKKSEKIGDTKKIEDKIASLKKKLTAVERAFNESVNIENVNRTFQKLIEY
jgi:cyclopropane fatty-acyl-phospholipid synthase-like methyltransferase